MIANDPRVKEMREAAGLAAQNAYSPYSKFPVGAAVLADGKIYTGCNVENASFGLTICAERSAIFQAIGNGGRKIEAVVVVTRTARPTPPCGACRQVINEFTNDADVFGFGADNAMRHFKISELLPEAFGPNNLK
jgi:cytidine deaminase